MLVLLCSCFDSKKYSHGDIIDNLNEIPVYYNGKISDVSGRNVSVEGYNYGLKWQCVEFVKRYYSEYLNHRMPNSYGHAKHFFNASLSDGTLNKERNLIQFTNPGMSKPMISDIIVFDGWIGNKYGHVAIVSDVKNRKIEIVQQNVGKTTRQKLRIKKVDNNWSVKKNRVLGWLRKKQ